LQQLRVRADTSMVEKLKHLTSRQILLIMLVLVATAALTIALREPVNRVVVTPLIRITWILDLIVRSVPQVLWLGFFVVVAIIAAIAMLARHSPLAVRQPRVMPREVQRTRYGFWCHHAASLAESNYSADRLCEELRVLLTRALSPEGDVHALRYRIRRNELSLPPDVQDIVMGTPEWLKLPFRRVLPEPLEQLYRRISARERAAMHQQKLERIAAVVAFVESQV
jgi:hypothetical protein